MSHARYILFGGKGIQDFTLNCEITRSSMTPSEPSFAQHIDELTHHIHPAYFKSAVIETLYGFTHYCSQHANVFFEEPVVIAHIVELAAKLLVEEQPEATHDARHLDALLQQSPSVLQLYVAKAIELMHGS